MSIYILCRIINTEDIILPQYFSWKFGRSKIWSTFWYSRYTPALFGSATPQHYQTFAFPDMSVYNLVFYTQSTSTVISGWANLSTLYLKKKKILSLLVVNLRDYNFTLNSLLYWTNGITLERLWKEWVNDGKYNTCVGPFLS